MTYNILYPEKKLCS